MFLKYSTTESILPPNCNLLNDHGGGLFILWLNRLGSGQPQDPWRDETHLFSIYDISHPISILSPIRNLPQLCCTSQFIRDQEPRIKKNHKDNLKYRVQFWFLMVMWSYVCFKSSATLIKIRTEGLKGKLLSLFFPPIESIWKPDNR